ncbi:hypothetical protein D3C76_1428470 [compost metagenome]
MPARLGRLTEQCHLDTDLAAFGELDGVGQQIAQHLPQELFGTVVVPGYALISTALQQGVIAQRSRFQQRHHFIEQLAHGEIHRLGQAGTLLQFGEKQHFIEDGQQPFAGLVQGIETLAVLLVQARRTQ